LFGAIARRRKVSLVFWAHDAMSGRHWTERIARWTVPDLVICNSHYTASTLPALYPGVRSVVVYAPVATRSTPIDAAVRHRIRAALRTEAASVVIVQASRSEAWKGHAVLVEALAKARHLAGWTWWQAGGAQRPEEAEYLEQLQVRARDLGITDRVRWLGERTDVPRLLAAADVYCQANVSAEPFGVVFIEALAAGLPVITTRLGGACEIVDETCGILVPPADPDSLCAAICTLIEDAGRRRALAMAAPGRARRLCSPATELAKLEEALARLATLAVPA
jgi:glycosyltransferase involved in cell wall biosynthesis